jgi:hypothetical protein
VSRREPTGTCWLPLFLLETEERALARDTSILPTFDINAYNINAAEGVKAACKPCTANCSVRDTRRRAFDHPRAGGRGDGRRAAGWAPRSCWRGRC